MYCSHNKKHHKACYHSLCLLFWLKNEVRSLSNLIPNNYTHFGLFEKIFFIYFQLYCGFNYRQLFSLISNANKISLCQGGAIFSLKEKFYWRRWKFYWTIFLSYGKIKKKWVVHYLAVVNEFFSKFENFHPVWLAAKQPNN